MVEYGILEPEVLNVKHTLSRVEVNFNTVILFENLVKLIDPSQKFMFK